MKIPFINLQEQYQQYKTEIDSAIKSVLDSSQYIMGENLSSLEEQLQNYTKAPHAIGCSSGTTALELALRALEIKEGDEVITTPFTFFATAEVIALVGATPVFVDIEEDTYNIDASKIEEKITPKTKAIIPVGIFGQPCDMDTINEIAKKHSLYVIEDGAQSFGAEYKNRKSCSLSLIGTTSFFPAKPLGCYGDGGAVFTQDENLALKIRELLNHGQTERYKHSYVGINGRLDAIQAAILKVKLKHFDSEIDTREKLAQIYNSELKGSVITPLVKGDRSSVYAQYSIRAENREALVKKLNDKGVPTAIHYPIPLYAQKVFEYLGVSGADFPVTELITKEILSLPFSPFLKEDEQAYIIKSIKEAL